MPGTTTLFGQVIAASVLLLLCLSHAEPAHADNAIPPSQTIINTIQARTLQFTDAHVTGDVAFINSCFTEDARVMGPDSVATEGMTAIAALNAEWVAYGVEAFTENSVRMYGAGDWIIDEGEYFLRYGPDQTEEYGKYLNVWTLDAGQWKIVSNIWNKSLPPQTN